MRELAAVSIATLIGVAVGASVFWWSTVPLPGTGGCGGSPSGNPAGGTPLGAPRSPSPPRESIVGTTHWYNSTITATLRAGGCPAAAAELQNLGFEIQDARGSIVAPTMAWNLTAANATGSVIGLYAWEGPSAGEWTQGGSEPVVQGDMLDLSSGTHNLSGDSWVFLGADGFSGSVTLSIP